MTVRVYKSTDTSAPAITTASGSLIAVLDACLVNGYGSQTAAGWTKPFSTSTTASYIPAAGNQFYLHVSDPGASKRFWGSETATSSAIANQTGTFPELADLSGGCWFDMSTNGGGWLLVATERCMYFWANTNNLSPPQDTSTGPKMIFFGDVDSYVTGDGYNTMVIGGVSSGNAVMAHTVFQTGTNAGHYICRSADQTTHSTLVGKFYVSGLNETGYAGSSSNSRLDYVSINGTMLFHELELIELDPSNTIRGKLPGLWVTSSKMQLLMHEPVESTELTFTSGPLNGKTLKHLAVQSGNIFIEISDTW